MNKRERLEGKKSVEQREMIVHDAKEEGLCFRCLEKLSDDEMKKKEVKGDIYCYPKCSEIMEKIL